MIPVDVLSALASERRLLILGWLRDPVAHFPSQVDGDLVEDGVCSVFIATKLGITQPSATGHLKILERAGLIQGKRIKQWVFYRRDEEGIAEIKRVLDTEL
ncbi:winged helix-turn-helix domain-containing protein [Sphaerisporangium flaviroseum]|uniref:Winged helix-turn-helix domain-containing protein n=1 Tax=Sphaerisporangium flaviroseum TaxID=509199 RepID=A0ABP7IN83_9ACTN